MTTRKHLVGQIQIPGQRPQDVQFFTDERPVLTNAEQAAGLQWVNGNYLPGDVRRYGDNTTPGTTDMTTAIANALLVSDTHRTIFQPETYLSGKLTPPAGASIFMPPGCVLKDDGTLGASERFLNLTNNNIHIEAWGAKIDLNSAYASGEQRHGVYIYGSHDIVIEGLESSNSGGDGFYIGGAAADPATDVRLVNVKADANRRQGISVVNARRFRAIDPECTNTSGTAPSAGIDIEPNATTDVLDSISIVRPYCKGNDGPGIEIFLDSWRSASNYCDIEIIAPYIEDNGAVTISGRFRPGIDINRCGSTTPPAGRIVITDPFILDEDRAGIHVYDWDINGPRVEIIRPVIINPNTADGTASTINGGIILHNSGTYTTAPGNVLIDSPVIIDDDDNLDANSLNAIRISGAWKETLIRNPKITWSGTHPWLPDDDSAPTIVSDEELVFETSNGQTMTDWRYVGRTLTNSAAAGTITHVLDSAVVGIVLDFALFESQAMRIDPAAGDQIVPTGAAAGNYIESSVRGSRVRLRCREAGFWDMENVSGTWVSE